MEWHRAPLVRLVIPFILGILAANYWGINYFIPSLLISLCAFVLLFFIVAKPKLQSRLSLSYWPGVAITFTLFLAGILAFYFSEDKNKNDFITQNKKNDVLLIKLSETPEEKNKTYAATAEIEWGYTNGKKEKTSGQLLVYFTKDKYDSTLQLGDIIKIKATLSPAPPPMNPGEFDYSRWLANKNIYYQVFLKNGEYVKTNTSIAHPIYLWAENARTYFDNVLKSSLPDSTAYGMANALLLGNRNYLNDDLQDAYARTGTIHILAVSGLHVGAIYLLLGWVLLPLKNRRRLQIIRALLILSALWLYAVITGLSPSVTRAVIMFSFIVFGEVINRKANIYNSLAASALFILCWDAKVLFSVGFQLSYLAVLGIAWLYALFYRLINIKYRIPDFFWKLACVSLAAQIATFPLSIYYFHQFPNYFLLSNLLIVPLASLALYTGVVLFILSPIPLFSVWAGKLLHVIFGISNYTATSLQNWPGAYFSGLYLSDLGTIMVYLSIIFLFIYIFTKKYYSLVTAISFCVLFSTISLYRTYTSYKTTQLTIYSLPKGQKALSFIDKGKAYLWCDSSISPPSEIYKRHIEPHFILANTGAPEIISGDFTTNNFGIYGGRFIALRGQQFLWADNTIPVKALDNARWDGVVVSGYSKKWREGAEKLNLAIHETATKGAWQVKQ